MSRRHRGQTFTRVRELKKLEDKIEREAKRQDAPAVTTPEAPQVDENGEVLPPDPEGENWL